MTYPTEREAREAAALVLARMTTAGNSVPDLEAQGADQVTEALKKRAQKLRKSLYDREKERQKRGVPAHLWPTLPKVELPFGSGELADWLLGVSEGMKGQVWKCAYTRELLAPDQITIDHRQPLDHVYPGETALPNFAITSARTNRIKGNLDREEFQAVMKVADNLSAKSRTGFYNRLAQPPIYNWSEKRASARKKRRAS